MSTVPRSAAMERATTPWDSTVYARHGGRSIMMLSMNRARTTGPLNPNRTTHHSKETT